MGGVGSGRRSKSLVRLEVETSFSVSIRELLKYKVFDANALVQWQSPDLQSVMRITAYKADDEVILIITYTFRSKIMIAAEASIDISWSSCNYGGQRPWFLCPGKNGYPCNQRVGKLYISDAKLLCRHCCKLGYRSDYETPMFRSLHKAQKILRRLGGTGSLGEGFPPQPKGMHFCTYDALSRQVMHHLDDYGNLGIAHTERYDQRIKSLIKSIKSSESLLE